jgi:hypothetical protein
MAELQKVRKAKDYDRKIINHEFDLTLIEYSNIDKVKEAASCILQLSEKINQLTDEKEKTGAKVTIDMVLTCP